ncbi:MAG: hypothetical protein H6838_06600 [Planctomycetes bacterium]|nr:hypothetical protein [Planctomycetota bacterium]MCB9885144.1 hypothetical protein [Planctomycetota bacterium]
MRGALEKFDGVVGVNIQQGDSSEFSVDYDPAKLTPQQIVDKLHAAGEEKTTLKM